MILKLGHLGYMVRLLIILYSYINLFKKEQKLYYINTGLDKDPFTYSKKGTFQKGKNIFLDAGFKDGVSLRLKKC